MIMFIFLMERERVGEKECKWKEIKNKNYNYKELLIILFDIKRLKKIDRMQYIFIL